jgi:cell division protein FtsL
MKKKKNNYKILWILVVVLFLAIPVCDVYTKAILSQTNIELEQTRNKIKEQEGINDSLKMEISELASLDKIQEVAEQNGLTYQNNNITVVSDK